MRERCRDVARGLTVGEMEIVNHLPTLTHALIGSGKISYADTVFPMFAFISGMSPGSPWNALKTVGLGLVYNIIKYPGPQLRPFGVLQRIGLSGLLLSAAPTTTAISGLYFPASVTAVWIALCFGLCKDTRHPFSPPQDTAQTRIDRFFCSLWPRLRMYAADYDPEGLLGALTTCLSMWFGRLVVSNNLAADEAFITSISLMSFGYMYSYAFPRTCPFSKQFWTLSYTLSTSGLSLLKYSIITLVTPYLPHQLTYILACMGQRSLEVFFGSAILDRLGFHDKIRSRVEGVKGNWVSSIASTALLAAFSCLLVKYNWRIR